MARMSESELLATLQAEKSDALAAVEAAKLSEERERAHDYYNGDMSTDMPVQKDRSQAVSSDVADTVEGLMPGLMEIFASGDEVVRFLPEGPEDVAASQQETDYINHVFLNKNPGFLISYTFVKDALLSKVGVVKVVWEQNEKEERETYLNQPDDVYALIAADPRVEIVEHTQHEDGSHDITVATKRNYGCCKVYNVPPEEYGISRSARSTFDAEYQFHEVKVSEARLIGEGWDADVIRKLPDAPADETSEAAARNTVDEDTDTNSSMNKATRLVTKTEHYVVIDYEQDGKPALYRITTGGKDSATILTRGGVPDIERMDLPPFAAMTPFIVTHRFFGKSAADMVMDIQRMKTALTRGLLDNVYLANNQRIEVAEETAHPKTLEDLLSNRPGGVVRTKRPGGLVPIPNQPIGDFVFPVLEYLDMTREWRTGVVRQGQGIDADALQNQSATAVQKVYNAAQVKMKLIARIFAETGFKDMFRLIHGVVRKNDRQVNTVRLRNQWVPVDPRNWKTRDDMVATVGLGSGGKQEQLAFWGEVIKLQAQAIQQPQLNIVKPKHLYNSAKKWMEIGGEKSADEYFFDPDQEPPPEPPPDPKMLELQAKMDIEKMQAEADVATQDRKVQSEIALAERKFELERELAILEAKLKEREHALTLNAKSQDFAMKRQMAADKAQADQAKQAAANG